MTDLAELGIVINTTTVRASARELDNLSAASGRAEQSAGRASTAFSKINREADAMLAPLRQLGAAMGIIFGAAMVRQVIELGDTWQTLSAKIALVTASTAEQAEVMSRLFDMSQKTRTGFEASVDLYQRLARAGRDLGRSHEEMLVFTEAVQQSLIIGGASTQEAASAMRQLGQALGRGKLSGDEFVSMSENAQPLMNALAQSLGVTTGELIKLAHQGALTANVVVDGVLRMGSSFEEQFSKIPMTVAGAMTQLENSFLRMMGQASQTFGVTRNLADGISFLARNLETATQILIGAAAAYAGYRLAVVAATIATAGFNTVSKLSPLGLIANLATIAGAYFLLQENADAATPAVADLSKVIGDQARAAAGAGDEVEKARKAFEKFHASIDPSVKAAQETAEAEKILGDAVRLLGLHTRDAEIYLEHFNSRLAEQRGLLDGNRDKLEEYISSLRDEADALGLADRDRAERLALDKAINIAMAEGTLLTGEHIEQIKELAGLVHEINETRRAQTGEARGSAAADREAELMLEPFKNLARDIQGLFTDVFEKILNGGIDTFTDIADAVRKIFQRGIASTLSAFVSESLLRPLREAATGGLAGISRGGWSTLGIAGGTLLGGMAGGNQTGSTIGGLVGGIGGSFFGPLGAFAGSTAGSLLGGLFGPGESSGPNARANLVLQNGQFGVGTFAGDNGADPSQVAEQIRQVATTLNAFTAQFGLTAAGGGWLGALGFGSDGGFSGSPQELIAQVLRSGAIQGSGSIGTALRNTRQTSLEGIGADLEFAKLYDELIKVKPEMTAVQAEVENLTKQFAEAKTRAAELGLSVSALDQAFIESIRKMRRQFNEGVQLAILGILDPDAAAMKQLEQLQDQRRNDAIALGADLVAIDRLSGLERQQLAEQQAEAMKATFDGIRRLMDDMAFGGLSPASSSDRLAAIQEKFMEVEARALGGDAGARAEFDSVARQYLDIARENFASSESFQTIFDRVLGSAESILGLNGVSSLSGANDNVATAVMTGTDNVVSAIEFLTARVDALVEENQSLRGDLQQFVAGQQAAGGRAA